jgi:dimethylglycine dehydrogenase
VREATIGVAPAIVMSVSFSGELAYEIHVPNNQLYAAYLALRAAGEAHGLKLFGSRAVESMRMEKGYLHWKADILTEFDPFETGLDRFVKMDKGDFIGKAALEERIKTPPAKRLITLQLHSTDAPAHGGASVMLGDKVVGTVSSGDWGHRTGMNLAYAFVDAAQAENGSTMHVDVLGNLVACEVIPQGPYDPDMSRVRG